MRHRFVLALFAISAAAQAPGALAQPQPPSVARTDAGAVAVRAVREIVARAVSIRVSNGLGATARTTDLTAAPQIAAVLAALGPAQIPSDGMSRCLTPVSLAFRDASGATLATVGLCDAPGLAASSRSQARIDVPGSPPHGLVVQDLAALRGALRPAGVDLP